MVSRKRSKAKSQHVPSVKEGNRSSGIQLNGFRDPSKQQITMLGICSLRNKAFQHQRLPSSKGKCFSTPNTRMMIHQPLGGASGQAIDVEIQAREKVMHNMANVTGIIFDFIGRLFEQVGKDIDRDRCMSPTEAVDMV